MSEVRRTGSEDECFESYAAGDHEPIVTRAQRSDPLCAEGCGVPVRLYGGRCDACYRKLLQRALDELEARRQEQLPERRWVQR